FEGSRQVSARTEEKLHQSNASGPLRGLCVEFFLKFLEQFLGFAAEFLGNLYFNEYVQIASTTTVEMGQALFLYCEHRARLSACWELHFHVAFVGHLDDAFATECCLRK